MDSSPGLAADHDFANKKSGRAQSHSGRKKYGGDGARREEQHMVYSGFEGGESPKDDLISNAPSLNPGASSFQPAIATGLFDGAEVKSGAVTNEAGPPQIPKPANQSRINIWVDGPSYGSPTREVGGVFGVEHKAQAFPVSPLSSSWVPDLPLPDEGSKKMQANGNGFQDAAPAPGPAPTPTFKPPPQDDGFFLD
jgi:hypothetical protein